MSAIASGVNIGIWGVVVVEGMGALEPFVEVPLLFLVGFGVSEAGGARL
jgi:hypothetical protein